MYVLILHCVLAQFAWINVIYTLYNLYIYLYIYIYSRESLIKALRGEQFAPKLFRAMLYSSDWEQSHLVWLDFHPAISTFPVPYSSPPHAIFATLKSTPWRFTLAHDTLPHQHSLCASCIFSASSRTCNSSIPKAPNFNLPFRQSILLELKTTSLGLLH